eukprot:COSAG02_NODE_105_length_36393_cov_15.694495_9_plen_93_part_00
MKTGVTNFKGGTSLESMCRHATEPYDNRIPANAFATFRYVAPAHTMQLKKTPFLQRKHHAPSRVGGIEANADGADWLVLSGSKLADTPEGRD